MCVLCVQFSIFLTTRCMYVHIWFYFMPTLKMYYKKSQLSKTLFFLKFMHSRIYQSFIPPSINQSINQSNNQSINQSISQSSNSLINQSRVYLSNIHYIISDIQSCMWLFPIFTVFLPNDGPPPHPRTCLRTCPHF